MHDSFASQGYANRDNFTYGNTENNTRYKDSFIHTFNSKRM